MRVAPLRLGARLLPRRSLSDRVRLLPSVVDAIGDTPLVELSRFVAASGARGRILAKLDFLNPGGSKKDRIARQIVEDARADGTLRPGQPVVELTSGNTGTGLAIVCGAYGHPFVAVMSRGNSPERARMMRALGAEVVLVDQVAGAAAGQVSGADLELVERAAAELVERRGAFRADQFHHAGSWRAHYLRTAPECWRQAEAAPSTFRERRGRDGAGDGHGGNAPRDAIDAFVDFVGSGGTLAGVARWLKERTDGRARCWAVEPSGAAVLGADSADGAELDRGGGHRIQGGGYSRSWDELTLLRRGDVDRVLPVSDEDAIAAARRLAAEEGLFGGFSAGANAHAALELLRAHPGRTVLIVVCDSGLKYLSTDLY